MTIDSPWWQKDLKKILEEKGKEERKLQLLDGKDE